METMASLASEGVRHVEAFAKTRPDSGARMRDHAQDGRLAGAVRPTAKIFAGATRRLASWTAMDTAEGLLQTFGNEMSVI